MVTPTSLHLRLKSVVYTQHTHLVRQRGHPPLHDVSPMSYFAAPKLNTEGHVFDLMPESSLAILSASKSPRDAIMFCLFSLCSTEHVNYRSNGLSWVH